ncbi:hypothetical protein AB1Y20_009084 [Prymnesium parvum]|uniref:Uncharacterized protein n=1 Tax=Prymnesium parvum TaxID=97485 RepID=A0AB34K372_PRYPA
MAERGTAARGSIRVASAETIARYTRPRPQGMAKPRPPPYGVDNCMPEYPAHRANSLRQERPLTPQQAMFSYGDEDDAPTKYGQPKDALDGFITSKANPLAQSKKSVPQNIFVRKGGARITAAETFPDTATPTSSHPPSGPPSARPSQPAFQSKAAGACSGGSTPFQPTNNRRGVVGAAYGPSAMQMYGSKGFGMSGVCNSLPAAGMSSGNGRRPPSSRVLSM